MPFLFDVAAGFERGLYEDQRRMASCNIKLADPTDQAQFTFLLVDHSCRSFEPFLFDVAACRRVEPVEQKLFNEIQVSKGTRVCTHDSISERLRASGFLVEVN